MIIVSERNAIFVEDVRVLAD